MWDLSDGSFMKPLRVVQFATSAIILVCAVLGKLNLPNFATSIRSPEIMLIAGVFHVVSTLVLIFWFYVFKIGTKKPVVGMTVFLDMANYGITIASFVNLMYDFDFSAKPLSQVCQLHDTINNPNPMLGCQFYQASLGFSAFGWFLWTISMTWNISRIHKLIRKNQMRRINSDEKEFANRADMESQASQYANRAHFTNSPLHDVNYGNFTPSL